MATNISECEHPHDTEFLACSKISTSESGFEKLSIPLPDLCSFHVDTRSSGWTEVESAKKKLRIKKYPDKCGSVWIRVIPCEYV